VAVVPIQVHVGLSCHLALTEQPSRAGFPVPAFIRCRASGC
jgi:hypothetical protein